MFICLDIETTGLNPSTDQIIEVAIVKFDLNGHIEEWSSLVNPGVTIPEFSKRLTGIDDEMVKDAPKFSEVIDTIKEKVGDMPIMGHFIFFDLNFLNHNGMDLKNTQLDTCQLTQILLHNEPSYSLEVLTKKLAITQDDAHRAMDDVKANIGLFYKLKEHITALSKKEKKLIKPILEKSEWTWAKIILPFLDEEGGEVIEQSGRPQKNDSEEHIKLEVQETPFLLEEAGYTYKDLINYALTLDEDSLLAVPDIRLIQPNKDLAIVKDPSEYIDEKRLKQYLEKDSLDATETMLGVKTSLWLEYTKTKEKSELRIIKEEKDAWNDICRVEPDKKAQGKKIMAIDHYYFLKERGKKEHTLKMPKNVIIGNVEELLKKIESAWHVRLSEGKFISDLRRLKNENPDSEEVLDHLASKVSILFGFLGMVMSSHGEPNDPRHTLLVETHHRNTMEWNKVVKSVKSIQAAASLKLKASPARDEFERYLTYLIKILQIEGQILWMTLNQDQQPILNAYHQDPASLFKERVWDGIENLHLFSHHGDLGDDFAFLKTELGLPEITTQSSSSTYPLPINTSSTKISSPNDPRNIKEVTKELSIHLPEITGNIFLLVTAKNTAEQFFYNLPKIIGERKLFVQNMGGGMGKIFQMSRKSDGNNLFVGNESFLNFLITEGAELSLLAVHRLPFSHPDSPIQKARSKKFNNAYTDFALPQAKLRLQSIFNNFLGNKWKGKEILMLDPRFENF